MKNKTVPAPAVTPHKWTAEEFVKEYQELIQKTGFQIAYEPRWAQSKDTGDYRLVIVTSVVPVSKE